MCMGDAFRYVTHAEAAMRSLAALNGKIPTLCFLFYLPPSPRLGDFLWCSRGRCFQSERRAQRFKVEPEFVWLRQTRDPSLNLSCFPTSHKKVATSPKESHIPHFIRISYGTRAPGRVTEDLLLTLRNCENFSTLRFLFCCSVRIVYKCNMLTFITSADPWELQAIFDFTIQFSLFSLRITAQKCKS